MINTQEYKRPWYLFNGHLESIIPYKTSKIYQLEYERERLELPDGDFLDVDWVRNSNEKLLVICHALEGNTRDYFVERAAKFYSKNGYDVLMWNYRSCSSEMNRLPRFYHSGDTSDLDEVINHGLSEGPYKQLFLQGYSMGGTVVINHLSQGKNKAMVNAACVFSTPLDLQETASRLSRGFNRIYGRSFLVKWKRKIKKKAEQFPELFDLEKLDSYKNLDHLHEKYTIALHGFESMEDYYSQNSGLQHIDKLTTPLLIVNAKNDPLLGPNSFHYSENPYIHTRSQNYGGHLGFSLPSKDYSWMEIASEDFFDNYALKL